MPRALFYQPSCGIAGDLHLAALIDLGVPEDYLRQQLARLPMAAEFDLTLTPAEKMGIHGLRAQVTTVEHHHHRHLSDIEQILAIADYSDAVYQRALAIFAAIAAAEGKIHKMPIEQVHFHEVGAIDSIVDVVAAALCIDYLAPTVVLSSAIELGAGFVDCAHGRLPVPAPATQEILRDAACTYGGVQGESTTPTGAAILACTVDEFLPSGIFRPERIGYGVGQKDFGRPNVLRVALGEYSGSPSGNQADTGGSNSDQSVPELNLQNLAVADLETGHFKIEANIDDMSAEAMGPLMDAMFAAGAVDVYITPIVMKKGRPAHCVAALADTEHLASVSDALLNQSTTIGLRVLPFAKRVLARTSVTLPTRHGSVRVKQTTPPNGIQRWKIEHDDIAAIAAGLKRDYLSVQAELDQDIGNYYSDLKQ
ncbi:MAG TPA: nickel pincer cofactor biosynthesis protein LarC [Gammaproteobacteria bacterium]|nr:nickel pincer cofactor biosynthesis protein LarC [Gammaproteobacteria bacterium]